MRTELGLDKDDAGKDGKDGKQDTKDEGTGRPREALKSGASNDEDEEPDPVKLADSILGSGT